MLRTAARCVGRQRVGWRCRATTIVASLLVVWSSPGARSAQPDRGLDSRIVQMLASVSVQRLESLLTRLVAFGTRDTYSADAPARGVHAAARWIHDELQRTSPNLRVAFDVYQVPKGGAGGRIVQDVELRNVVAVLPGRSARRIYLTAHYDSLSRGAGATGDAPGANDNGSGTVLLLEAARVLAAGSVPFDATLVFMATAGEEQGLVGARLHEARARESGLPIEAVFNNDIVGGIAGEDGVADATTVRLYSAGPEDSPSRALARFTSSIAAKYLPAHRVLVLGRSDRLQRSGDHVAFPNAAAVGFRESREHFARQHNATDTIDTVSFGYLAQNTRVNVAALASLALAPAPPALAGMSTSPPWADTVTLRWKASGGALGYRLYWRQAWGPDWQQQLYLGAVTEHSIPRAIADETVLGIAAVGPDGHESPISSYQSR